MTFLEKIISSAEISGGKFLKRIGLSGQSEPPKTVGRTLEKGWPKENINPRSQNVEVNSHEGGSSNSTYVEYDTVLKTVVGLGATGGVYIKYQDYLADIEKKSLDENSRHNKNIETENERHHRQTEVDNRKHHSIIEKGLDQQNRQLLESNKLKNTENQLKEQELDIQRRKMENDSQQKRYLAERTWSQFIFGKKKN